MSAGLRRSPRNERRSTPGEESDLLPRRYVQRLNAMRVSNELDLAADSSLGRAARPDDRYEWHFTSRAVAADVPVSPQTLPQLLAELRCRFGDETLASGVESL